MLNEHTEHNETARALWSRGQRLIDAWGEMIESANKFDGSFETANDKFKATCAERREGITA